MMTNITQQEIIEGREAFEKWYQSQFTTKIDFKRYAPDSAWYDDENLEEAYETWIGAIEYIKHGARLAARSDERQSGEAVGYVNTKFCGVFYKTLEDYKKAFGSHANANPVYLAAPQQAIPSDSDLENLVTVDKRDLFDFVRGAIRDALENDENINQQAHLWAEAHDRADKCLSKLYAKPAAPTAPIESDK
jgi:hypothetical protein